MRCAADSLQLAEEEIPQLLLKAVDLHQQFRRAAGLGVRGATEQEHTLRSNGLAASACRRGVLLPRRHAGRHASAATAAVPPATLRVSVHGFAHDTRENGAGRPSALTTQRGSLWALPELRSR